MASLRRQYAFTLLEVLLSLSIIVILLGISTPVYQSLQNRNDLDLTAATITQQLRRAQLLARAVNGDSAWGVYLESSKIILYKGKNYALRDPLNDEISEISKGIIFSGINEINFNKFFGEPSITGSIILTSPNNETKTVFIKSKGMVDY